ncbi:hypothetical protein [Microbacterium maritypicum]
MMSPERRGGVRGVPAPVRAFRDPSVETGELTQRGAQDVRVVVLVEADPRAHRVLQDLDIVAGGLEQLSD